jgi:hypothetical protein
LEEEHFTLQIEPAIEVLLNAFYEPGVNVMTAIFGDFLEKNNIMIFF